MSLLLVSFIMRYALLERASALDKQPVKRLVLINPIRLTRHAGEKERIELKHTSGAHTHCGLTPSSHVSKRLFEEKT